MIRKGEAWGSPVGGPPAASGAGGDAALAALVQRHPGARLEFQPDASCDFARAVGLTPASPGAFELTLDAIALDDGQLAVNAVVVGPAPDRLRRWHRRRPVTVHVDSRPVYEGRATTVIVANGQFLRGADLVPRGHPGDGRLEVQIYAVPPGQRPQLRRLLAGGGHLPHPQIATATGRRVEVVWSRPALLEVDGRAGGRRGTLGAAVVPAAFLLVV